jgi:hypothetical protein
MMGIETKQTLGLYRNCATRQRFVESEVFLKNPIGVEFDPDWLVARYEAGDSIEELKKQGVT